MFDIRMVSNLTFISVMLWKLVDYLCTTQMGKFHLSTYESVEYVTSNVQNP